MLCHCHGLQLQVLHAHLRKRVEVGRHVRLTHELIGRGRHHVRQRRVERHHRLVVPVVEGGGQVGLFQPDVIQRRPALDGGRLDALRAGAGRDNLDCDLPPLGGRGGPPLEEVRSAAGVRAAGGNPELEEGPARAAGEGDRAHGEVVHAPRCGTQVALDVRPRDEPGRPGFVKRGHEQRVVGVALRKLGKVPRVVGRLRRALERRERGRVPRPDLGRPRAAGRRAQRAPRRRHEPEEPQPGRRARPAAPRGAAPHRPPPAPVLPQRPGATPPPGGRGPPPAEGGGGKGGARPS